MSNTYQRRLSLTGINTAELAEPELRALAGEILDAGIHGLCFSPYVDAQGPGTEIGASQIRERLAVVQDNVRWLRTFSCTEGNELIPAIAAEAGLQSMVGVWLDEDLENNERELANAAAIVRAGNAGVLAVGNEVLLRGDLSEQQLLEYIARAQAFAGNVPVGYVDAYFQFEDHPAISSACDLVLANCYPFWEGCPAQFSVLYLKDMYRRAQRAANGKAVIVTETGWPNLGSATGAAEPGIENAIKYFVDACRWADEDNVELFYFAAFDEAWKVGAEGDVGAYWGLWDKDARPKYQKV